MTSFVLNTGYQAFSKENAEPILGCLTEIVHKGLRNQEELTGVDLAPVARLVAEELFTNMSRHTIRIEKDYATMVFTMENILTIPYSDLIDNA